jgi:hypothetical protein
MNSKLPDDLRQVVSEHGNAPIYLVDEASKASYVLLPAEQYERLKARVGDIEADSMYRLLAEISPEDWEDASNYGIQRK